MPWGCPDLATHVFAEPERVVAPSGWLRGLHQPMPSSLHQQLQIERTAGATVTVLGADAEELEAMRRTKQSLERVQDQLNVERDVAQEQNTTVAGGVSAVLCDALSHALADSMLQSGGALSASNVRGRVSAVTHVKGAGRGRSVRLRYPMLRQAQERTFGKFLRSGRVTQRRTAKCSPGRLRVRV